MEPPAPEPLLLQVETGTACNGRCTFCTHRRMRRRGTAKWSTILHTLYHYAHRATEICPFGMQEPLLDPRFSAILANCKQLNRNARTVVYSNLTVYDEAVWREVITRNTLDYLHVSFYGVDRRTYQQLQPGFDYDATQRHITQLLRLRHRLRWNKPVVRVHLILTPDTAPKATRFLRRWQPIVDDVAFVHYDAWHGDQPYDPAWEQRTWGPPHPRVPCHRLWSALNVHYDGTLVPCCIDYQEQEPVGNILDDPDAWFTNPRIRELRQLHVDGRWDDIPLCRACSLWRYEHPVEWRTFWQPAKPVPCASAR